MRFTRSTGYFAASLAQKELGRIPSVYNSFLEWSLWTNHKIFHWVEALLNHVCSKSILIYPGKAAQISTPVSQLAASHC